MNKRYKKYIKYNKSFKAQNNIHQEIASFNYQMKPF